MTGSHRAPKPPSSSGVPPWAIAVAVVVALIPAAWFGGNKLFAGDSTNGPSSSTTTTPIPPVSPSATQTSSAKPTKTPVVTPTTPANLPTLTPDQPRRLVVPGIVDIGFDNAVDSSQGRLEPSSTSEVSRWASRGSPGSPGVDTVVIVGEDRSKSTSALSGIGAAKIGTKVVVRTDQGDLTYTISRIKQVPADSVTKDPLVAATKPGRLVLVVVKYTASGDRLTKDTLLVSVLTGAKPA